MSELEVHHYYYIRDGRSGEVLGVLDSQWFLIPDRAHHTKRLGMLLLETISYSEYETAVAFEFPAFVINGSDVCSSGVLAGDTVHTILNKGEEE